METQSCPALFISAPGSNHGKTTITAALARLHVNQGRKVRVFKTGPDFLDPMILQRASAAVIVVLPWLEPGALMKSAGHDCVFTLKLHAFLRLDTLFLIRMFDRTNIADQIGQFDQAVRRMAASDNNVEHFPTIFECR